MSADYELHLRKNILGLRECDGIVPSLDPLFAAYATLETLNGLKARKREATLELAGHLTDLGVEAGTAAWFVGDPPLIDFFISLAQDRIRAASPDTVGQ